MNTTVASAREYLQMAAGLATFAYLYTRTPVRRYAEGAKRGLLGLGASAALFALSQILILVLGMPAWITGIIFNLICIPLTFASIASVTLARKVAGNPSHDPSPKRFTREVLVLSGPWSLALLAATYASDLADARVDVIVVFSIAWAASLMLLYRLARYF